MALSEGPAWDVHTLKTTVNHSRTIDLSNRVVLHISLPASPTLMAGVQEYSAALLSTSGFKWRRWCFQGDCRKAELEGAREVSAWTFSSAPASCTSPSSCSLSLWIQGRGGSRGHREGRWGRRGLVRGGGHWMRGGTPSGGQALEISVVRFNAFQGREGFGVWVWVEGCLGTWRPASHSRKLASFTRTKQKSSPGHCPAVWVQNASHRPKKQELRIVVWLTPGAAQHLYFLIVLTKAKASARENAFPFFTSIR